MWSLIKLGKVLIFSESLIKKREEPKEGHFLFSLLHACLATIDALTARRSFGREKNHWVCCDTAC